MRPAEQLAFGHSVKLTYFKYSFPIYKNFHFSRKPTSFAEPELVTDDYGNPIVEDYDNSQFINTIRKFFSQKFLGQKF